MFLVLGVPYPLLLGMIIAVVALVPMIGPEMIFGPIALYYLLTQDFARGLALLALGIIFLTIIPNNFILPRLASASASIHPLITLMAFTAPIFVIGLVGVIVGPAVFGFILAAYRTMVYFRKATFEAESAASSMPYVKVALKDELASYGAKAYRYIDPITYRIKCWSHVGTRTEA